MIIKHSRQLPVYCSKLVFINFLILIFILQSPAYSKSFEEYGFEKSETLIKADSLLKIEFYDQAEKYYRIGLNQYKRQEIWEGVIYAYNKLGFIVAVNYEFSESNALLSKAWNLILKHIRNENLLIADNYMYKGINFDREGIFDSSLYYHDEAIKLKIELFGNSSQQLAESLRHKAQLMADFGSLTISESLYRESITMYEEFLPANSFIFGKLYSSLSSTLRKKYDYKNAVMYAEKSNQIIKNSKPFKVNSLIIAHIILGNIHNAFLKYEKAINSYDQAYQLIENDPNASKKYLFPLYQSLASLYNELNNPDKAFYYLEKIKKEGMVNIDYDEAFTNLLASDTYRLFGDIELAKKLANKALNATIEIYGENDEFVVIGYELLGKIYKHSGDLDSALFFLQKALISLIPEFNDINIYATPTDFGNLDALRQYDILYKKADIFRAYYFQGNNEVYLKKALEIYNLIDDLNDATRNSKMADGSLFVINEYFKNEYDKGIDCAYLLYTLTGDRIYIHNAFSLMEKSKYMLLFKSLTMAEQYKNFNLPVNLKNYEDSLKSHYISFQVIIDTEYARDSINQSYINELENKKFIYERALDDFKLTIQEEYPAYAQIKYDSLTITYADFKSHCTENNGYGLEYYWGEDAIYLVTTLDDHAIFKFEKTMEFDTALTEVLSHLANGLSMSNSKSDFISYCKSAYTVFNYLLKDVLENSDLKSDKLLIIPDGPLSQLPFEAILTAQSNTDYVDYQKLPYLIYTYETGYVYSANLLLSSNQQPAYGKNEILAFSYSNLEAIEEMSGRSEGQDGLPHSAVELNAIKRIIGSKNSKYYYNFDATESQFKKQAFDYQIIHLAVHGESDTASAINSKLIFKDQSDTEEDGKLYMHELYGLDLSNVNLAVLSACETGVGKQMSGEGVFSMARSFAYAGCPNIVMSLWRVNDNYTSDLMANFYKYLKKGENTSKALRNSKLNFLLEAGEKTAHPSNWAAFVSVGKNPMIFHKSYTLYYFIFIAIAVSALLIFIRLRKQ